MEILLGILSWNFGDSFGPAFDSWWSATLWISGIALAINFAVYLFAKAYAYITDSDSVYNFFESEGDFESEIYSSSAMNGLLFSVLGVPVLSFVLLVFILAWEITAIVGITYGLMRTARGVVRLKKQLAEHTNDKDAHS